MICSYFVSHVSPLPLTTPVCVCNVSVSSLVSCPLSECTVQFLGVGLVPDLWLLESQFLYKFIVYSFPLSSAFESCS